jgi:hypothetical protein
MTDSEDSESAPALRRLGFRPVERGSILFEMMLDSLVLEAPCAHGGTKCFVHVVWMEGKQTLATDELRAPWVADEHVALDAELKFTKCSFAPHGSVSIH